MKRKLTLEEVALYKLRVYKCDYRKLMTERIGAADRHGKPKAGERLTAR